MERPRNPNSDFRCTWWKLRADLLTTEPRRPALAPGRGGVLGLSGRSAEGARPCERIFINSLSPVVAKAEGREDGAEEDMPEDATSPGHGGPERHPAPTGRCSGCRGGRRTRGPPPWAARCASRGLRPQPRAPSGAGRRAGGGASSPGRPVPHPAHGTTYQAKQLHVGPACLRFEPTVLLKKLLLGKDTLAPGVLRPKEQRRDPGLPGSTATAPFSQVSVARTAM